MRSDSSLASPSIAQLWAGLSVFEKRLIGAFIVLKVALLVWIPLTGDEAYFIWWGQNLAWGYYDHPPAVGWVNAVLSLLGDHLYVYRGFAFAASVLMSWLLYRLLVFVPQDNHSGVDHVTAKRAFYVALAFFVSPVSLMFVINANDTVLALFAMIGFYFFARALHSASLWPVLWGGVFLGLAFLSKYFAAFMLTGLLVFSVVYARRYGWKRPLVMAVIVLAFVAENLWFNWTHCWNNILFNFFSRTRDSEIDLTNTAILIAMLIAMLSPKGVYDWVKEKAYRSFAKSEQAWLQPLVLYAALPLLLVLLMVSLSNPVGLHWPLLSIPILYLLYAGLSSAKLKGLLVFNGASSLLIAAVLLGLLPFVERVVSPAQQHQVALYLQTEQVCEQLTQQTLFTLDYSSQSTLAYYCGNDDIHVFMSRSKYGREDDKLTDFKALDGTDLTLFATSQKDLKKIEPFFESLDVSALQPLKSGDISVTYYLVAGQSFNYARYREEVLEPVYEKYYTGPAWLPQGTCAFKTKYGFE